jgi:UDP-N-acetylmuramate-alanine ligase
VPESRAVVPLLREIAQPGDVLIFLGAGDIGRLAREYLGQGDA